MSALTGFTAASRKSLKSHVCVWLNREGECFPSGWPWWKGKNVKDASSRRLLGSSPQQAVSAHHLGWLRQLPNNSNCGLSSPSFTLLSPPSTNKRKQCTVPSPQDCLHLLRPAWQLRKSPVPGGQAIARIPRLYSREPCLFLAPHHQVHRQKSHDIVGLSSQRHRRLESQTS